MELQVENVKRLKAVTVRPDGSLVVINGNNAQGKSSLLDSIAYALGGKALCPEDPIRHGEENAEIKIDLGDLIVQRRFTAKTSTLKVTTPEGAEWKTPQTILDGMLKKLTLDPLAFSRMDNAEQMKTLCGLAGFDLDAYRQARKEVYDERTLIGRDIKQAKAVLDELPEVDDDLPTAPINQSEAWQELKDAQSNNREIVAVQGAIEETKKRIERLEAELEEQRACLAAIEHDPLQKEIIDEAPIEQKIRDIVDLNDRIGTNNEARDKRESLEKLEAEYEVFTKCIERLDAERDKSIANANLPVDGLSVQEGGVFYRGVPLDQASSAERLRVSCAIGMADNPEINIQLIRDGSLLDEDGLGIVAEMADAHGAQVWIERVGKGDEAAIVIEDGEVV